MKAHRATAFQSSIENLQSSISWVHAVEHARERNRLPHVLQAADPRHRALNAHTEPAVRHAAVLAQVEIPFESFLRQSVLVNALPQQFVGTNALRAANNLAVTFGRQ